jgi:peptide/nickel transport system substrate-binding protein
MLAKRYGLPSALGLMILLAACSTQAPTQAPGTGAPTSAPTQDVSGPEGDLNVGLPLVGPFLCQPRLTESAVAGRAVAVSGAYEPLIMGDDRGNYVGVLAESWSVADDQTTWTFKLRQGIQFHKGYGELTADDVVYSLTEHAREDSLNGNRANLARLLQSITAVDPYTVEINTGTPQIDLLFFLRGRIAGTAFIISKKQAEEVGDDQLATVGCAGTGPWEYVESSANEFWRFKAVENHYRKTPEFATLTLWEVPEESTRVANFQRGQLDTMVASPDSLPVLLQTDGAQVMAPSGGVDMHLGVYGNYYVKMGEWPGWDPTLPWVSASADPSSEEWQRAVLVRQALAVSIDRATIVEQLLGGIGEPSTLWGWRPHKDKLDADIVYEFNPDEARRLLAEANYPDGFDITLNVRIAGAPAEVAACEAIATMWTNIGLNVTFENVPNDGIRGSLVDRSHNGIVCQAVGEVPEPINQYVNWARSTAGFSGGIEHPVLDDLILRATTTLDPDARMDIEREIARFTFDNALDIGVYTTPIQWPISGRVTDWSEQFAFGDGRLLNALEYAGHR